MPERLTRAVRTIALVAFGLAVGLTVVEVSLQIAAVVVWRGAVARERAAAVESTRSTATRTILCVGDSYTYGEGASSERGAYPAQLEQLLNARSGGANEAQWRIVNRGWPGRNSAELLQRLPLYLRQEHPNYVAILVGTNDRWSHREMDLEAPTLASTGPQGAGQWRWELRVVRLIQLLRLRLRGSHPGTEEVPQDVDVSALRARVDDLRRTPPESRNSHVTAQLLQALAQLRRNDEVVEEGLAAIARHGPKPHLCALLVEPLVHVGRPDEAMHWADEGLRRAPSPEDAMLLYRGRVYADLRRHDFKGALADALRGFAIHKNQARLERELRKIAERKASALDREAHAFSVAHLDDRLTGLAKEALENVRHGVGDDALESKLGEDLRRMVALVRESGATPILLAYPFETHGLAQVVATQRRCAMESGVALVDLVTPFAPLITNGEHDKYFTSDDHCTDAGYQMVARQLASTVVGIDREGSHRVVRDDATMR